MQSLMDSNLRCLIIGGVKINKEWVGGGGSEIFVKFNERGRGRNFKISVNIRKE